MKLKDSRDRLTAYAFACGYVQSLEIGQAFIILGRYPSTRVYYVKATECYGLPNYSEKQFTRLDEARQEFNRAARYERALA